MALRRWAGIIAHITGKDPQAAAELLASIAELPGSAELSSAWQWAGEWRGRKLNGPRHPEQQRPGRSAPPAMAVREGAFAVLYCMHTYDIIIIARYRRRRARVAP